METRDAANIGLSEEMHLKLKEMTDNGVFSDMKDGYRLAASIALSHEMNVVDRTLTNRKNMYDVGGVDENFIFKNAVSMIYPEYTGLEYRQLEKLADAGIQVLYDSYERDGMLNLELLVNDDT